MTTEYRVVPIELLKRLVPPAETINDGYVDLLTAHTELEAFLAVTMPPAGGEPEVVGKLVVNGGGYDCWHPDSKQGDAVVLLEDHRAHVTRLQAEVSKWQSLSSHQKGLLDLIDRRATRLQADNTALRDRISKRLIDLTNMRHERDRLQTEVERLSQSYETVHEVVVKLKAERVALQAEVERLNELLAKEGRHFDAVWQRGLALHSELTKALELIAELESRVAMKDAGIDFRDQLINEAQEIAFRELPSNWLLRSRARLSHQSAPAAKDSPKTCIECDQPYCHGVCVERGDDDERNLSRAIHDGEPQ